LHQVLELGHFVLEVLHYDGVALLLWAMMLCLVDGLGANEGVFNDKGEELEAVEEFKKSRAL
jgi:hypothetical protein